MADLDIDTSVLADAGASLRVVATEFDQANSRSDTAAEAVGHPELADHVREFAHNWDDRRAKMLEGISALAQIATDVGEQFEDVEQQLVANLEGRA